MLKILETAKDNVLGFELIRDYSMEDEQLIEEYFNELLAKDVGKINMLIKINELNVSHVTLKAFFADGAFTVKNIKHCGHIAIVGHSKIQKMMVSYAARIFNRKKKGLEEKYFDVEEMDAAWEFMNA